MKIVKLGLRGEPSLGTLSMELQRKPTNGKSGRQVGKTNQRVAQFIANESVKLRGFGAVSYCPIQLHIPLGLPY